MASSCAFWDFLCEGYPVFLGSFALQECLQKDSFNHSPRQAKICPSQVQGSHSADTPPYFKNQTSNFMITIPKTISKKLKSRNAFVAHQTSGEKASSLGRPQIFQTLAPSFKKKTNKNKLEYPKAFHYNSECYQVVNYFSNLRADKKVAQNQHWLRELTLSNT